MQENQCLPQKDMNMAKKTVAGLSNRYVILANTHEELSFW